MHIFDRLQRSISAPALRKPIPAYGLASSELSISSRRSRWSPKLPWTAQETMIRPIALLRIFAPVSLLFFFIYIFTRGDLRRNIEENVPSSNSLEILIPKTIHQLLISMPSHPVSKFQPNSHTTSWVQSGWKIEYWSEDACAQLAQENATSDYSETFQQLPTAVLRSDFCRYLILFRRGGVYNDLDVHKMRALPWNVMGPSEVTGNGPPRFIVGLEGDASTKGLPRSPQFLQWTIVSTPSHPILQGVLTRIAERTPSRSREQDVNKDIDIMSWTGPSVWTDAVLDYLDCTEEQIKTLQDLKEPLRFKDVLVLPKRYFAVTQGEDHSSPDILVKHYFSGTWKKCEKSWISYVFPWSC